jgi:D-alanyl-D-alanine carboxypeptidase
MPRSIKLIAAVLISLTLTASGPIAAAASARSSAAGSTASGGPHLDQATDNKISQIVMAAMRANDIPGMAVGVWIPGGHYVRAFGTSDTTTGAPFSVADHVRIASITKTFTATVILQLVDQHRLQLSSRLSQYVTGIPNGATITVKELLNMTSGVYDFTEDKTFLADYLADPTMPFGPADAIAIIKRHKPSFPPGKGVEYSDSNYVLLQLIAEKVTHAPLGRLIQQWVLDPLGLDETSYPTTPAMPTPFTRGYFQPNMTSPLLRDVTLSNPDGAGGAGAMISTLSDLKTWAKALATGTLLAPGTQRERLQTVPLAPPGKITLGYGLGILDLNGFLGHNGAILGYGTAAFYLPGADATFVVEGNNNDLVSTVPLMVFVQIADLLYPQQFPDGV